MWRGFCTARAFALQVTWDGEKGNLLPSAGIQLGPSGHRPVSYDIRQVAQAVELQRSCPSYERIHVRPVSPRAEHGGAVPMSITVDF